MSLYGKLNAGDCNIEKLGIGLHEDEVNMIIRRRKTLQYCALQVI